METKTELKTKVPLGMRLAEIVGGTAISTAYAGIVGGIGYLTYVVGGSSENFAEFIIPVGGLFTLQAGFGGLLVINSIHENYSKFKKEFLKNKAYSESVDLFPGDLKEYAQSKGGSASDYEIVDIERSLKTASIDNREDRSFLKNNNIESLIRYSLNKNSGLPVKKK